MQGMEKSFSAATTTDTIKRAGGRSLRIKENKSSWCLKAYTLAGVACHVAVVTSKYKMETSQMDSPPQEYVAIS